MFSRSWAKVHPSRERVKESLAPELTLKEAIGTKEARQKRKQPQQWTTCRSTSIEPVLTQRVLSQMVIVRFLVWIDYH